MASIKEQPQLSFDLNIHPNLLKAMSDVQEPYDGNDLIKILILECIDIVNADHKFDQGRNRTDRTPTAEVFTHNAVVFIA